MAVATIGLTEFFARRGSHISDRDAKIVGPVFERLWEQGRSDAKDIVNEARPDASPLHPYFEWDDSEAAERWREEQARKLEAAVVVHIETPCGDVQEVRAFHAIRVQQAAPVEEGAERPLRQYVPVRVVTERPDMMAQVRDEALRYLIGWRQRYEAYCQMDEKFGQAFQPTLEALEHAEEELKG